MPKAAKRTTADIHKAIADKVIAQMETAGTGWAKDWAVPQSEQPTSMSTGREYRGINWLILGMARAANGYTSGRWATYKQWKSRGAQVRKGERGEMVVLYKPIVIKDKETGEDKAIRLLRTFSVFNADQVDGYDAPAADDFEWSEMPATAADDLAERAGALVKNADPSSAFYVPSKITSTCRSMPVRSAESYAGTLLHELTHWSGHETAATAKFKTNSAAKTMPMKS